MRPILSLILAFTLIFSVFCSGNSYTASADNFDDRINEARGSTHYDTANGSDDSLAKPGEILIKVKEGTKKSTINKLNKEMGASIIKSYKKEGIYLVKVSLSSDLEDILAYYRHSPIVEYAEENFLLERAIIPNDTGFVDMWNLQNLGQSGGKADADIDAPEAWEITTDCSAVVVAIMDDGIEFSHTDLVDNLWINQNEIPEDGLDNDSNGYVDDIYGYDFADSDANVYPDIATDSTAGHGTHVAGIIGAVGDNGIGITGICWNVKLMTLKIFDKFGSGSVDSFVDASNYAISMKNSGINLKVINMSFGSYAYSNTMREMIKSLRDNDILVVAAAGNNKFNTDKSPFYPASYSLDNIISVGASDDYDRLAKFSNYGKNNVDILAPGVDIKSTIVGNNYDTWSGTSMAAPHVAGLAALIATAGDNYDEIRAKILNGADTKTQFKGKAATSGRINAYGALTADSVLPDISVISIDISAVNADLEATTTIKLKNQGGSQSDTTIVEIFAATDEDFNDIVFTDGSIVGSLKPNSSEEVKIPIEIDESSASTLYVLVVVDFDNFLSESDEENNTIQTTMLTSNKDVKVKTLSVGSKIDVDSDAKASVTVENIGKSTIEDAGIRIYLSVDKELDDSDTVLTSSEITVDSIKVKKTKKTSITFDIPAEIETGTYYIIAKVDPDDLIAETNETNNIKSKKVKLVD